MNKRKLLVLAVSSLAVIGLVILGMSIINGQSDGTIMAPVTSKQPTNGDHDQLLPESDQYAAFGYPADYVPITADPPSGPVLARHLYSSQEISGAQVAVQIVHLPDSSLNDDGSYNLRNTMTSRFVKEQRSVGGTNAIIFTDNTASGFNKVAYVQHDSLAASIALTSSSAASNSELQAEFESIIGSWQWL